MAISAEEKRKRRANATPQQRKQEADRGKHRRKEASEGDRHKDRVRRTQRRQQIMEEAMTETVDNPDDDPANTAVDAANESLDMAAARAHWYRQRVQHRATVDETTRALLTTKQEAKAAAASARRQRKGEAKRATSLALQQQKALAIAKSRKTYEERRQKEADAKATRDAAQQRVVSLRRDRDARTAATSDWIASTHAHFKTVAARVRSGQKLRELPWAPKHLVQEARDGAAWTAEPETIGSRILPSLAAQAPRSAPLRRPLQWSYYDRAFDAKVVVPVGRKTSPCAGSIVAPVHPCAWQRAEETLFEEWCCDAACEGCLRPTADSQEPSRPYDVWSCVECESFAVCGACYINAQVRHPHALRLYRMTPWV